MKLHFFALCDEFTVLSHEPVDFIEVKVDGHLADQRLEQDLPDYVDLTLPFATSVGVARRRLEDLEGVMACGGDVIKPQVEWFDLPVGLGMFVLASGFLP